VIELDFSKLGGLVPAVIQDFASGEVLMVGFMDQEAWDKTLDRGEVHYFSRTRKGLWHKGATSGHVQKVREVWVDCDQDTVLIKVDQVGGAACHTGMASCFFRRLDKAGELETVGQPVFDPRKVYGA